MSNMQFVSLLYAAVHNPVCSLGHHLGDGLRPTFHGKALTLNKLYVKMKNGLEVDSLTGIPDAYRKA